MDKIEAAKLIEDIASSLKEKRGQFRFEMSVTGTQGTGIGGGTGINVNVSGGGIGSSAIGLSSSVPIDGGIIKITNQRADEAFH